MTSPHIPGTRSQFLGSSSSKQAQELKSVSPEEMGVGLMTSQSALHHTLKCKRCSLVCELMDLRHLSCGHEVILGEKVPHAEHAHSSNSPNYTNHCSSPLFYTPKPSFKDEK